MRKVGRIYLKGLRHDIGRILLANESSSLSETEKKGADIERYLRGEQKEWWRTCTRPPATYNQRSKRPTQTNDRPLPATGNSPINKNVLPFSKMERIPFAVRQQVKCFKCSKSGYVAPQCQNFRFSIFFSSQRNLLSPRVNQMGTDENEDAQQQGEIFFLFIYWNSQFVQFEHLVEFVNSYINMLVATLSGVPSSRLLGYILYEVCWVLPF